jgi:hypothetical protein
MLSDSRVYLIAVFGTDKTDDPTVTKFLDSFRIML